MEKFYTVFRNLLIFFLCYISFNANAATRTWIGAGSGGTLSQNDLAVNTNWSPSGVPSLGDSCIMNFVGGSSGLGATGSVNNFALVQSAALNFKSLIITFSGNGSGTKTVSITISQNLTIANVFSLTNSSSGTANHGINFNIIGGISTFYSVITVGSSTGASVPLSNISISSGAKLICSTGWSSSNTINSNVATYVRNSGALTINGTTVLNINNPGNNIVGFLLGNNAAITTFNGDAEFDSTTGNTDYNSNNGNKIILGATDTTIKGSFYFNGSAIMFGYAMGTDSLQNGIFYFDGTVPQTITSYSNISGNSPDRTVGNFLIGDANIVNVAYNLGVGGNKAMNVSNSLVVNNNCTLSLNSAIIPSDGTISRTDGFIQIKAGATLNLGIKGGSSATLPKNYSLYNFDTTSTVNYDGTNQVVYYSGTNPSFHYGNLKFSNSGTKTASGSFTVLGNLEIDDAAVFDANNTSSAVTDSIAGNWTNNSTGNNSIPSFTSSGTGKTTLDFNGNSTTTIGGTYANSFYNLKLDKSTLTANVSLTNDLTDTNNTTLATGILNINGRTLTLNGTTTGNTNGTISGSATSILNIGGTANTLYFTPGGTNNYLKNFTVAGTAKLLNALNITASNGVAANTFGTVTINSSAVLSAAGFLTLKSDKFGDAVVAVSAGKINGSAIVERYIPARRAWRLLTVPFQPGTGQTINAAWQESQQNLSAPVTCPSTDPAPNGFGMYITNNGTANGYDWNTTAYPSLKIWNGTQWVAPASTTSIKLSSYPGYYAFIRGDRHVCIQFGQFAGANATTLRDSGQLKETGAPASQSYSATKDSFVVIGNPYASPVDFTAASYPVSLNTQTFYILDPKIGGTYGVGKFIMYNTQVPGGWTDTTGSYKSATGPIIQSGQAFLVKAASTASGSITFPQTVKSVTEFNTSGFQSNPKSNPRSLIYTELLLPNDSLKSADNAIVIYGDKYEPQDSIYSATKFWSSVDNISVWKNSFYAISCRPSIKITDTIFYKAYLAANTNYALKFYLQNMSTQLNARAFLVDNYLHNKTEINLNDTTLFNFTTNADTNSYRNRFMLVLNKQLLTIPVPVSRIINRQNPDITGIASTKGIQESGITVYPNPVTTTITKVKFINVAKGYYEITIHDAQGKKLTVENLWHGGSNAGYNISLNAQWPNGLYLISIWNNTTAESFKLKLVISR